MQEDHGSNFPFIVGSLISWFIKQLLKSKLSVNDSNSSRYFFGDYREIKLHTLSPILISKFIPSWRKWISKIFLEEEIFENKY